MPKVTIANVCYTVTDETFYVLNSPFEDIEKYQGDTLQKTIANLEANGWNLCGKVQRADMTAADMMTDGNLRYLALWEE